VDVSTETKNDILNIPKWKDLLLNWKAILFLVLLMTILGLLFFGEQLGFVALINHFAQIDLSHINR
jgi:hypothetical protein